MNVVCDEGGKPFIEYVYGRVPPVVANICTEPLLKPQVVPVVDADIVKSVVFDIVIVVVYVQIPSDIVKIYVSDVRFTKE